MDQVSAAVGQGLWATFGPKLFAWGKNTQGQLGLGNTIYYSSPKQVGALTTWSSISGGSNHSLAIKTDGTLWTWGYNYYGQLGFGNTTSYSSPDRKSTRLNSSHSQQSRMPSSA